MADQHEFGGGVRFPGADERTDFIQRPIHARHPDKPPLDQDGIGLLDDHLPLVDIGFGDHRLAHHRQRRAASIEMSADLTRQLDALQFRPVHQPVFQSLIVETGFHVHQRGQPDRVPILAVTEPVRDEPAHRIHRPFLVNRRDPREFGILTIRVRLVTGYSSSIRRARASEAWR